MSRFSVAALQLRGANGDNSDAMMAEIDSAVRRFPWVDMVVLAELNVFGASTEHAQPMPGPMEGRFREMARRHGIWLLPGSMYEAAGGRIHNTTPVIDPKGAVIARYRKQFPWAPYEVGVAPGSEFVVFDVPEVGRFGVSICYDMWFPETTRTLAWMGAEVILHPSLTSTIDRDAEIAIVRASAATNQCYFFDVNLAGPLGTGCSCVAGPGGEILYQAGREREVFPLVLDLDYVRDVRRNGWQHLGQPLKSFRDSRMRFPPYAQGHDSPALQRLGELRMASRKKPSTGKRKETPLP